MVLFNDVTEVVFVVLRSIFVNDHVCGAEDTDKGFEQFTLLVEILHEGGFDVHKFLSNDRALMDRVEKYLGQQNDSTLSESYSSETLGNRSEFQKVLGIFFL